MDTTVLVALITGGFSFLGALIASALANSKTLYRIEQLEAKVDKHNNMIERTYKLEQQVSDIEKRLK